MGTLISQMASLECGGWRQSVWNGSDEIFNRLSSVKKLFSTVNCAIFSFAIKIWMKRCRQAKYKSRKCSELNSINPCCIAKLINNIVNCLNKYIQVCGAVVVSRLSIASHELVLAWWSQNNICGVPANARIHATSTHQYSRAVALTWPIIVRRRHVVASTVKTRQCVRARHTDDERIVPVHTSQSRPLMLSAVRCSAGVSDRIRIAYVLHTYVIWLILRISCKWMRVRLCVCVCAEWSSGCKWKRNVCILECCSVKWIYYELDHRIRKQLLSATQETIKYSIFFRSFSFFFFWSGCERYSRNYINRFGVKWCVRACLDEFTN